MTPEERQWLSRSYERMLLIRGVEERLGEETKTGELPGPVHLSIGQEAVAVGVTTDLRPGDWVASTHRGHGHFLGLGGEPRSLVAEIFGRATGICGGKGGSMHVADFSRGMIGANGIVGAGIGLAAGAALTAQLAGLGNVAVAFFGDGGANEGIFFEALNLAAIWKLPLIFVCENNGWSEFTSATAMTAGNISERAGPFGIPHRRVDGNDVMAVHTAATGAISLARGGQGPSLLEMMTYRTRGHVESESTFLPSSYRDEAEVDAWRDRDPIAHTAAILRELGADDELGAIEQRVQAQVADAFEFAAASPWPEAEAAHTNVFAEAITNR